MAQQFPGRQRGAALFVVAAISSADRPPDQALRPLRHLLRLSRNRGGLGGPRTVRTGERQARDPEGAPGRERGRGCGVRGAARTHAPAEEEGSGAAPEAPHRLRTTARRPRGSGPPDDRPLARRGGLRPGPAVRGGSGAREAYAPGGLIVVCCPWSWRSMLPLRLFAIEVPRRRRCHPSFNPLSPAAGHRFPGRGTLRTSRGRFEHLLSFPR